MSSSNHIQVFFFLNSTVSWLAIRWQISWGRQRLGLCYAWSQWPQCKGVCLALWSRKNYRLQVKSSGLFFLLCLFFFCAFSCSTSFVSYKNSVVFFACCCSSQFWLCLFVRSEAFPASISLPCLSLLLESFIPWTSPFPAVFFLPILFFLRQQKMFVVIAVLLLCFLVCFSVVLFAFFFAFCCAYFARVAQKYIPLTLSIFAVLIILSLLCFGACWCCCFSLLAPRLDHTCPTMPPLPSPMPRATHFSFRSVP